jgi:hypothetical protein
MTSYKLISADSHVSEPTDLWFERVETKYRDRAPRLVANPADPNGAYFYYEGYPLHPIGIGLGAGKNPEELAQFLTKGTYADARPGGWDPAERLKDNELDGVEADVLSTASRSCRSSLRRTTAAGLPYYLQRMDRTVERGRYAAGFKIQLKPSEYVRRQMHCTYIDDYVGVANRHFVGVDRMMWSSDYPHQASSWPHSQDVVARDFKDASPDDRFKITRGNVAKLYGFTL